MPRYFWRILITVIILVIAGTLWATYAIVSSQSNKQLYDDVQAIPKNKVGLLLGTAKYQDKGKMIINQYYQNRIDATVALYMAGKIDYVIVSGDNSTAYYNEPLLMKQDLIARGVPEKRIYMDNAGFRTLDSILRCRDIFGQDHFTIISQEFHNQRAIYICNHKHVKAIGYNAKDDGSLWDIINVREKFARVKMVIDLILNKQARYYGERIDIK